MSQNKDMIKPEEAGTLAGLFRERIRRTPDAIAFRQYDEGREAWGDTTWLQAGKELARWQAALAKENLPPGSRVALMVRNCQQWVMYDQAALSLGLVPVPLYVEDRAENVAYILKDSGAQVLLLMNDEQCRELLATKDSLPGLKRIISMGQVSPAIHDDRLMLLSSWLPAHAEEGEVYAAQMDELATLVYTSGTTGRPKGVMLSHKNILSNAWAGLHSVEIFAGDVFLSFLPLSHTLERTIGYYLPVMAGSTIAYARSVLQMAEDLLTIKPHVLVSVPRIFERVHSRISAQLENKSPLARGLFEKAIDVGWQRFEYTQGRSRWQPKQLLWPVLELLVAKKIQARLGGRIRVAISGGAALSPDIAHMFIGLGLNLYQGYGLTETSPVLTVNRYDDNLPASIGTALPGIELSIGKNDELLAKGDNIMLGYWNLPEASAEIMQDGWLCTGDKARIDELGHVFITGRIKEIIVLANGEKVPPADMEMAICLDPLFEQVMVVGEGKPYLSALVVLNPELWEKLTIEQGAVGTQEVLLQNDAMKALVKDRICKSLSQFPGYAQIRQVTLDLQPWTIENEMLTPKMSMKRKEITEHYTSDIGAMYEGH
ncbi:MAG: long-chain fatty acid--CoA ligase [Gammaproteobacteria bacterium]|nr:long-chain fatty acid--CoA ligase [Gammaproteobacteria bacterium]